MPCGSPERGQRFTIFESARRGSAAEIVSSAQAAANLLLECVGEVFDDCIREEFFAHLTNGSLDFGSWLPTIRKRKSKQFAHPHIFQAGEAQRTEGVLDGLTLRVED